MCIGQITERTTQYFYWTISVKANGLQTGKKNADNRKIKPRIIQE